MRTDLTELGSMWLWKVLLIISAERHTSDLGFAEIIFILV